MLCKLLHLFKNIIMSQASIMKSDNTYYCYVLINMVHSKTAKDEHTIYIASHLHTHDQYLHSYVYMYS